MQNSKPGEKLTVGELISNWGESLQLSLISGKKGLNRLITENRVQKIALVWKDFRNVDGSDDYLEIK